MNSIKFKLYNPHPFSVKCCPFHFIPHIHGFSFENPSEHDMEYSAFISGTVTDQFDGVSERVCIDPVLTKFINTSDDDRIDFFVEHRGIIEREDRNLKDTKLILKSRVDMIIEVNPDETFYIELEIIEKPNLINSLKKS